MHASPSHRSEDKEELSLLSHETADSEVGATLKASNLLRNSEFMKDILCWFGKKEIELRGSNQHLATIPEKHIKRFDGYRAYYFPDNGKKMQFMPYSSVWYGVAIAEKEGVEHVHMQSPAFNYTLEGTGIFVGKGGLMMIDGAPYTAPPSQYHGKSIAPGLGFEIPAGMPHGHKVINGPIKFFFVQACGFNQIDEINENPCIGDFHRVDGKLSDNRKK